MRERNLTKRSFRSVKIVASVTDGEQVSPVLSWGMQSCSHPGLALIPGLLSAPGSPAQSEYGAHGLFRNGLFRMASSEMKACAGHGRTRGRHYSRRRLAWRHPLHDNSDRRLTTRSIQRRCASQEPLRAATSDATAPDECRMSAARLTRWSGPLRTSGARRWDPFTWALLAMKSC